MGQEVPDYFESKKQTRQTRKNSLFSRRSVLKTLTLFIPPLAGWSYSKYESGWLDLSKQTVPLQGLKKEENLKLLHISDLHLSKTFPWIKLRPHFEEGFLLHQMLASLLETLLQTSQVTMNFKHSVIFSPNFLQKFQLACLEIMMVEVGLPLMEGLRHLKRSGGFYKKQGYAC